MEQHESRPRVRRGFLQMLSIAVVAIVLVSVAGVGVGMALAGQQCSTSHACWDPPYEKMPDIAPPIVRTNKYLPVPDAARGPAIDPVKGYRVE